MSEKAMRQTMRDHFVRDGAHWQRIEDSLQAGIPDINLCWNGVEFWIEAKQMDADKLPKRPATPIRMGLKPEQCLWLRNRKLAGGRVLVVAKLGQWWYVFNDHFEALRDGATLDELDKLAVYVFHTKFDAGRTLHAAISQS